MDDFENRGDPLLDMGEMTIRGSESVGSILLPGQTAGWIIGLLSAGRIQFVTLAASPSGRDHRVIKSCDLVSELADYDVEGTASD
jgi:hypothetical protein